MDATYPLQVFHFRVKSGNDTASFADAKGLSPGKQELRSIGDGDKTAGPGTLTFERGIAQSGSDLFSWLSGAEVNSNQPRNLVVDMINEHNEPVTSWNVTEAFPVKISGPSLKAPGNEVAIESLELAYEKFTMINQ